jgi:hypothetical protein
MGKSRGLEFAGVEGGFRTRGDRGGGGGSGQALRGHSPVPFGAPPLVPRYLWARTLAASAHRRRGGSSGNASTQRRSGGTRDRIAPRAAPREGVPTTQLPRAGAWSHGQDRRWTSGYCVCVIARCSRPGAAAWIVGTREARSINLGQPNSLTSGWEVATARGSAADTVPAHGDKTRHRV